MPDRNSDCSSWLDTHLPDLLFHFHCIIHEYLCSLTNTFTSVYNTSYYKSRRCLELFLMIDALTDLAKQLIPLPYFFSGIYFRNSFPASHQNWKTESEVKNNASQHRPCLLRATRKKALCQKKAFSYIFNFIYYVLPRFTEQWRF